MGDKTSIEWTRGEDGKPGATWNPVRGCSIVSSGCSRCYAMRQAHRFSGTGKAYDGLTKMTAGGPVWTGAIKLVPELLDQPLRWKRPRRIFVNSMSDLFHEDVPFSFIGQVFAIMSVATRHTFQVLTKRPERMLEFFKWAENQYDDWWNPDWPEHVPWKGYDNCGPNFPFENVWIGVSTENQTTADERIPLLLQTPAAVRWISAEPLLGPLDLTVMGINEAKETCFNALTGKFRGAIAPATQRNHIDWVVAGGESGPRARPAHPDWFRSLRDQCKRDGVAFFMKQLVDNRKKTPYAAFPSDLQVREYPNV